MTRSSTARGRPQPLDDALRGLFRRLERRPTPEILRLVVAQLEAATAARPSGR